MARNPNNIRATDSYRNAQLGGNENHHTRLLQADVAAGIPGPSYILLSIGMASV